MWDELVALVSALFANTVSLWAGVLGLIATAIGLFWRNVPSPKMFLLAGVVALLLSPVFAWRDEHRLRLRIEAEQAVVRPSVLIEDLSPDQLRAYTLSDPRNAPRPQGYFYRGFMFARSDQSEVLFFNVRNVGKVPARQLKYQQQMSVVDDKSGKIEPINLRRSTTTSEVLFPEQISTRTISVPAGTFFRNDAAGKYLRIDLTVTYTGQLRDKNEYFYSIVLKVRPAHDPAEMGRHPVGGVTIESSDEGVWPKK